MDVVGANAKDNWAYTQGPDTPEEMAANGPERIISRGFENSSREGHILARAREPRVQCCAGFFQVFGHGIVL